MIPSTYLLTIPLAFLFFFVELLYFRIADHFSITDKPNHRSSHSNITIRGGGIIFPLAIFWYYPFSGFNPTYFWFVLGLVLISLVSFWDDMHPVSNRLRLTIHLLSTSLIFYSLGLFGYPFYLIILGYILIIGTINAYNFMDGINGITGLYSLTFLISIIWLNQTMHFIDNYMLIPMLASCIAFLFFNFRKKAKCFAGDVGSVSMAFIICFLLISLIIKSQNPAYLGFLFLYGIDTISTIIFRLIRRENIFEAHRSHFYQFLVNQKKLSALSVSTAYALAQLLMNIWLIQQNKYCFDNNNLLALITIALVLFGVFVCLRFIVEGRKSILGIHT